MTHRLTSRMKQWKVPVAVLADRQLSVFEAVVAYLKDERKLSYRQIALLTNRNDRTIWTVYSRAGKKRAVVGREIRETGRKVHSIPISIFQNRKAAVLEAISVYLRDVAGLTYHEIAVLTNRDDRTIWTVYSRAKKKIRESNAA